MFGLLKGATCGLSIEAREIWWQHICGVCLALHRNVGQVGRLTTNYDSALLSLLYSEQLNRLTPTKMGMCILRKPIKAHTVSPDSVGAQFGAALALIMASINLQDQIADEDISQWSPLSLPVNLAAASWAEQGSALATKLGFDSQPLFQLAQSQLVIESQPNQSFDAYAWPTEQAVGLVFSHTAVLAQKPHHVPLLMQIGKAYGRLMYLFDSYKDFKNDVQQGKFNALAETHDTHTYTASVQSLWRKTQQKLTQTVCELNEDRQLLSTGLLTKELNRLGQKRVNMPYVCGHCLTREVTPQLGARQQRKKHDNHCCLEFCSECCCQLSCECCCHVGCGCC